MKIPFKTHDVADTNVARSVRSESTIAMSGNLLQDVEFDELYVVMA